MRTSLILFFVAVAVVFGLSIAFGNPDMLPKHPGYPMGKSVDPVKGQPTANDAGQTNAGGERALQESARFDDPHTKQSVSNSNDQRLLEKPGAGILPKVQGPNIKIEPPVKEATKANASPQ